MRKKMPSFSSFPSIILLFLFTSYQITPAFAGALLSCCQDPQNCPPTGPPSDWRETCANDVSKVRWACLDVPFPTVACLAADMRTCGNVGPNTVFYSFGSTTVQARTGLRDHLDPKGVMFNDALPQLSYWTPVINLRGEEMGLTPGLDAHAKARDQILVARYAQALAKVATGTAYIVVLNRNGEGGGVGAYQEPLPNDAGTNVWRQYEFPELMQNDQITDVISVAVNQKYDRTTDWQPHRNDPTLPYNDADALVLPPLAPINSPPPPPDPINPPERMIRKRGPPTPSSAPYCSVVTSSSSISPRPTPTHLSTSTNKKTSTPKATPTHVSSKISTHKATSTHVSSKIPRESGRPEISSKKRPGKTGSAQPTATPKSNTVVQLSKNKVHVGSAASSDLSAQMHKLLPPLCPDPAGGKATSCSANGVTYAGIDTLSDDVPMQGDLTWTIEDSLYTTTGERDAMLAVAIQAFVNSATGKNCKSVEYGMISGSPCAKKDVARNVTDPTATKPRGLEKRWDMPPGNVCHGYMTICNGANLITVELNQPDRPEAAYMNIEASFKLEDDPSFFQFLCELTLDAVEFGFNDIPGVNVVDRRLLGDLRACCESEDACLHAFASNSTLPFRSR